MDFDAFRTSGLRLVSRLSIDLADRAVTLLWITERGSVDTFAGREKDVLRGRGLGA
ncbi:hypothetical protein ACIRYZ_45620 [Kitasatospora sp. NPDC101155]|uniref:hypothetical protein n=1 Tax=Kitasatospora sp. NPDC101155 TaxID=3364097 RepID=UPI0037F35A08